MRLVTACALAFLTGGCAATTPAVAVQGNDLDVALMAGRWEGTYEGIESGRKGTVALDLHVGYRMAEGSVMMNAVGDPEHARPLPIQFVQVEGQKLSGKIDPYPDPRCNCMVETAFIGQIRGHSMSGTFTTHSVDSNAIPMQSGRWTAARKD